MEGVERNRVRLLPHNEEWGADHCYNFDEEDFGRTVGFRDYLNAHPETAWQYDKLKEKLAIQYPDDRVAYTAGKEVFILHIYDEMALEESNADRSR